MSINVNKDDTKQLMLACKEGDLLKVKSLIKTGKVTPNNTISKKTTPLMLACRYSKNNKDIVKYLLKKGADTNIKKQFGETALSVTVMYSTSSSTEDTVKMLLEAGSNPNIVDEVGRSALHKACIWSTNYVVKLLLEAGCNPNIHDTIGFTALHLLIECYIFNRQTVTREITDVIKLLFKAGANINCQTDSGSTPLMFSISNKMYSALKLLLQLGADPNILDNKNKTTLSYVLSYYYNSSLDPVKVIKLLLKFGAHPNRNDPIRYKSEEAQLKINSMFNNWFPTLQTLSLRYIIVHSVETKDVPKSVLKFTQYK